MVSGRPGALTHVAEEPARGGFDEVEYFLETVGSTVIGVGHFLGLALWREFQKQPHAPIAHFEPSPRPEAGNPPNKPYVVWSSTPSQKDSGDRGPEE